MTNLEIFVLCWFVGIIGFLLGCAWVALFKHQTDAEIRYDRHIEETSERLEEDK
jgi:hypothetical protein